MNKSIFRSKKFSFVVKDLDKLKEINIKKSIVVTKITITGESRNGKIILFDIERFMYVPNNIIESLSNSEVEKVMSVGVKLDFFKTRKNTDDDDDDDDI